jgi:hypothetical protein
VDYKVKHYLDVKCTMHQRNGLHPPCSSPTRPVALRRRNPNQLNTCKKPPLLPVQMALYRNTSKSRCKKKSDGNMLRSIYWNLTGKIVRIRAALQPHPHLLLKGSSWCKITLQSMNINLNFTCCKNPTRQLFWSSPHFAAEVIPG